MAILKHYWRISPHLPRRVVEALESSLETALQSDEDKIDGVLLRSLVAGGFDAKPRNQIVPSRRFEDDIRLCEGADVVSIEIENYGNRLEFDLLKMMSFAETIPETQRAWGCLIVPANKVLENPYISGNGRERIWDYLTKRLMPMTLPIKGLRILNILVMGFEQPNKRSKLGSVKSQVSSYSEWLSTLVKEAWVNAGKPGWDLDRTVQETIEADAKLEKEGKGDPAPKFRASRKAGDHTYMRQWVLGCRFGWFKSR